MSGNKYKHNYEQLYPDTEISQEIMDFLIKSERKMEYMEYDLNREQFKVDLVNERIVIIPIREDSYDLLQELNQQFQVIDSVNAESQMERMQIIQLHQCLEFLNGDEYRLVQAIFFLGLTERKYAKLLGISQAAVNKRKHRILLKLKKLFKIL